MNIFKRKQKVDKKILTCGKCKVKDTVRRFADGNECENIYDFKYNKISSKIRMSIHMAIIEETAQVICEEDIFQ